MVSNNNISSPSNKSSTTSEDSEVYTPINSTSPVTGNAPPPSSPPAKQPPTDQELPPQSEQTPARFLAGCSKLDLEPNPFEQSFSHVPIGESSGTNSPKPSLPPVASIASPSPGIPPSEGQYGWSLQSLRSGPLSPSMLEGPQNPIVFDDLAPNARTGTTPLPYNSFSEASPRSAAIFGAAVNSSIAMPVVNINNLDPYGRNVFAQGVPRPFTDTERSKIASNPVAAAATVSASPNVTNIVTVSVNPPATVQSSVPITASGLMSVGNTTAPATSTSNVLVTNPMTTQPVILGNGQATLTSIQQPQESQRRRNSTALSDAVLTKTEKDDLVSHVNNELMSSRNTRYSNGMSANVSVTASSTASSDDGFDDDSFDMESLRAGASSSSKSTTRSGRRKAEDNLEDQPPSKKGHQQAKVKNDLTDEEKRRNFLERNRQAALKCRQRKKQWLANLQAKVEYLTQDNENLRNQTASLRDEVLNLKTLLIAHKDCPITQAQGGVLMGLEPMQNVGGIPQPITGMNVGPNGVSMGVGVGMVSNGMQGNVSGSNMSANVPGIAMSHVQVQPHMSNQMNGQTTSGMVRF